ncbi:MAG: hypothetical protein SFY69_08600 [Planctomycetota bacterium]|nr:hypothetical protein [Planctomycetota bacterium]
MGDLQCTEDRAMHGLETGMMEAKGGVARHETGCAARGGRAGAVTGAGTTSGRRL